MKTYITDDYQVTVKDDASIVIFIPYGTVQVDYIIYNPGKRKLWTHIHAQYAHKQCSKSAKSISELRLSQGLLKKLHKALEVVNRQDIMDAEIVFVKDDGWKKVREEGDFDVYAKKPWYSIKPYELRVLRDKGETVHHKGVEEEEPETRFIINDDDLPTETCTCDYVVGNSDAQ